LATSIDVEGFSIAIRMALTQANGFADQTKMCCSHRQSWRASVRCRSKHFGAEFAAGPQVGLPLAISKDGERQPTFHVFGRRLISRVAMRAPLKSQVLSPTGGGRDVR
jgi:hypothetical protein